MTFITVTLILEIERGAPIVDPVPNSEDSPAVAGGFETAWLGLADTAVKCEVSVTSDRIAISTRLSSTGDATYR